MLLNAVNIVFANVPAIDVKISEVDIIIDILHLKSTSRSIGGRFAGGKKKYQRGIFRR